MKYGILSIILTVLCLHHFDLRAQDSAGRRTGRRFFSDSTFQARDSTGRFRDTTGRGSDTARRGRGFASLFADSAKLGTSDYQAAIERAFATLTMIQEESVLGDDISRIEVRLADADSSLSILKDNISNNGSFLNLRNLELYRTLLYDMREKTDEQKVRLDSADVDLGRLRSSMRVMIEDTVLRELYRDTVIRKSFSPQLKEMRTTWRAGTKQLKESLATINLLQTHNSKNAIVIASLIHKVDDLLNNSLSRIFTPERNYIWNFRSNKELKNMRAAYRTIYDGERKATRYYFKNALNSRLLLLLIGLIFLIWTFRNLRSLKKAGRMDILEDLSVRYLYPYYIASSLVVTFVLAPLFDLHAPAVYIESMEFFLILALTYLAWKQHPRRLFYYWLVIVFLFIAFSFTHHTVLPGIVQRFWLICLNVLSITFGYLFLRQMQKQLPFSGFLRFVILLHNVMNALAILCNVTGRLSLAQILGNAAIFSFTQAVGLAIFGKICIESILLQIEGSRARQGIKTKYSPQAVLDGFKNPLLLLVVILWLIVFFTNLNLFTAISEGFTNVMRTTRQIGNAAFTIGGVLLFFGIIWIAHLLQKYVGYFFGDTGDEEVQNKRQRSRMLIARLIVLCIGYLLAVAASGLPVDKITIVLGALGVGIGLGLQNIVSNFVSGIILIFDRPLQIGDSIEIGSKAGKVREIGLRSSTLLTSDGAEVIIPNGDILSQQITNWTLSNSQQRIAISVKMKGEVNIEQTTRTITETILGSEYHAEGTQPQILFKALGRDSLELKLSFWCDNVFRADEAASEVVEKLHAMLPDAEITR
ncbi:mechanosensitive ion channel family protein [Flavihumibacter petaseus]|uniref:MscS family protein n=1 Tax=Flavihumibacter petaseus NBRC 106054 TaxID=1220578 RepID=A0A0E9N5Q0_9BACT|nr:mechanosensitive ion channel domain-containing protein [Flavihumibacter petaseus]GAO45144.1 MscS family protein [Flavihumibacter petaseus NBRC 106054]